MGASTQYAVDPLTARRKVLLDSNVPHDLRPYLSNHDTFTASYLGWQALQNGELLAAAEAENFDILVTGDLSLKYQQNLAGMKLAIVSLSAINWTLVEPHIKRIVAAVDAAMPGSFVRVECGTFSRRKGRPEPPY